MVSKNKFHHGNLRAELIQTAVKMISEEGLEKVTMRALGQRVGVSRTAPYRHFANKTMLLCAIAKEGCQKLTLQYQKINQDTSIDTLSKLMKLMITYIEFSIKNPCYYKLIFGHEIIQQERTPELLTAAEATFNEILIAVEVFLKEYNIELKDPLSLATMGWATLHGLSTLILDGQLQMSEKGFSPPSIFTDDKAQQTVNIQQVVLFSVKTLTDLGTAFFSNDNVKSYFLNKE